MMTYSISTVPVNHNPGNTYNDNVGGYYCSNSMPQSTAQIHQKTLDVASGSGQRIKKTRPDNPIYVPPGRKLSSSPETTCTQAKDTSIAQRAPKKLLDSQGILQREDLGESQRDVWGEIKDILGESKHSSDDMVTLAKYSDSICIRFDMYNLINIVGKTNNELKVFLDSNKTYQNFNTKLKEKDEKVRKLVRSQLSTLAKIKEHEGCDSLKTILYLYANTSFDKYGDETTQHQKYTPPIDSNCIDSNNTRVDSGIDLDSHAGSTSTDEKKQKYIPGLNIDNKKKKKKKKKKSNPASKEGINSTSQQMMPTTQVEIKSSNKKKKSRKKSSTKIKSLEKSDFKPTLYSQKNSDLQYLTDTDTSESGYESAREFFSDNEGYVTANE